MAKGGQTLRPTRTLANMAFHAQTDLANPKDAGAMFASPSLCRFLTSHTKAAFVELCQARFLPDTTEQRPRSRSKRHLCSLANNDIAIEMLHQVKSLTDFATFTTPVTAPRFIVLSIEKSATLFSGHSLLIFPITNRVNRRC